LLQPNVLDFIDTAFGTERLDVGIAEVFVQPGCSLVGQTLVQSPIRQEVGVIILAMKPAGGAMVFNPAPDSTMRAGDCLIVVGEDQKLKKLESLASPA
jgi:voltage-gated potassium channel